jgi:hypothetical protein
LVASRSLVLPARRRRVELAEAPKRWEVRPRQSWNTATDSFQAGVLALPEGETSTASKVGGDKRAWFIRSLRLIVLVPTCVHAADGEAAADAG